MPTRQHPCSDRCLNGDLSTSARQDSSVDEFNIFHDAGSQMSVTLLGPDASMAFSAATPLATGFIHAGKAYSIQTELVSVADQVFPAIAGAHNPYLGTGKVDFIVTPVVTTSGFGNGPGLSLGSILRIVAKVDLAFIYLPVLPSVPEPATWALAGLGLGLATLPRRSRAWWRPYRLCPVPGPALGFVANQHGASPAWAGRRRHPRALPRGGCGSVVASSARSSASSARGSTHARWPVDATVNWRAARPPQAPPAGRAFGQRATWSSTAFAATRWARHGNAAWCCRYPGEMPGGWHRRLAGRPSAAGREARGPRAMTRQAAPAVALLYPGDRAMRDRADPAESRFAGLFAAFAAAGVQAQPAVYHDDFADEVAEQLRRVQVVLVWCNPIEGGRRRDRLDAMLRDAAASGVQVSAHPDAILRLGTKDVLVEARNLPFGSDVHRVDSLDQLAAELPVRLRGGARVLKQHRGHSGIGVWRVESTPAGLLKLRHAQRGSEEALVDMPGLLRCMAPYFEPAQGGHMIDQAWQPRLAEGMVRAYLVDDRVTGFGHQAVNALHPSEPQPGPRLYHPPELPAFQALKRQLESGWIDRLREQVGLARERLPLLWDCDFMLGDAAAGEARRFVLCEVNVSSVSPFPPSSIAPLVEAVKTRLGSRAARGA